MPAVALEDEEQAFWPVPIMGTLETVTSSLFNNVPVTITDGPFNLFKPSGGVKWTALPLFAPLATADDPVGLIINDTAVLTVRSRRPRLRSGSVGGFPGDGVDTRTPR